MMMNPAQKRAQLNREAILSASPARLLTMLYDRLLLDLNRAEAAQQSGDWAVASENLVHAQDIIAELVSSLNMEIWDGAQGTSKPLCFRDPNAHQCKHSPRPRPDAPDHFADGAATTGMARSRGCTHRSDFPQRGSPAWIRQPRRVPLSWLGSQCWKTWKRIWQDCAIARWIAKGSSAYLQRGSRR